MEKKKKFVVPHVYVLLLIIIFICTILTYIIPAGSYQMMTLESGREVVDAASFAYMDSTPVGLMGFLSAVPNGLVESASIIFFIFVVGAGFGVVQDTGAIEASLGKLTKSLSGKESLAIPLIMLAFAFAGAVIGMAEEVIPFIPIMVCLAIAMGFDSMTGAAMVLCGAGAGFAGAFMNPFTVGVAQGIADLPIFSGMGLRIAMFACMFLLTSGYVVRYAKKVKQNPELSSMREFDLTREDAMDMDNLHEFGGREKAIMCVLLATIILLVYGVITYGWYLTEISALFMGMSIVVACISTMTMEDYGNSLAKGMTAVAAGALIVGIARGILVVMTEGNIIHTILYAAATFLGELPSAVTAVGIYIFQCLLNFIVPSGSGQAAVSMPIIAPLADLVGVTRQTAVLAFQMGDGISNIFTPTSGYFMAAIAIAKIPWTKWAKWILPLIGMQYLLGMIFVIIAQMINYGPF